jgi:predicted amidohydrolase YtcJ
MSKTSKAILIAGVALFGICSSAHAQTGTLQDLSGKIAPLPKIIIYPAREIITLDGGKPKAGAVAVVRDRILAVGELEDLKKAAGDQPYTVDSTFANNVIVPGFIAQHDHPVLTALTMASEILSIEDWVLPTGTVPRVQDKQDFVTRLSAAEKRMTKPNEPLVTWGYHASFFGKLTRADLDRISLTRPILVWGRSCHELFLNSEALKQAGVTKETVAAWAASPREQSNFEEGHFWEQGFFSVLEKVATMLATPERLNSGLLLARDYMHAKGITYAEP